MDKNFEIKLRKFLEEKPLYSWMNIELPEYEHQFCNLNRIEMQCSICKTSRPFTDMSPRGSGMGMSTPKLKSTTYHFYFTCNGCSSSEYAFYIDVDVERKRIRKVGQNPPWSINSDEDLERFLKEDYDYFKKAMICESQGDGIAAFAYYRRVVENSINKILETLKVVLEAQNAEPGKIQKIEEALKGTIMDERIKLAKDAVPGSLRPNNINPLETIYKVNL